LVKTNFLSKQQLIALTASCKSNGFCRLHWAKNQLVDKYKALLKRQVNAIEHSNRNTKLNLRLQSVAICEICEICGYKQ
jgi:hypothetical protein